MVKCNRDLVVDALLALGWRKLFPSPTKKYQVFTHHQHPHRILIGRSGAVRKTAGSIAQSFSISDTICHKALIETGKNAHNLLDMEMAQQYYEGCLMSINKRRD